ncbi:MAG: BPSS1780 family membrane protein, partial [Lysobacter sp.]
MNDIRKVPFGAGAEWLLGGIALLRKAPLALGLLGLIWGGLSALATASGQLWLSLLLALAGPLLFGGILYAAREVDHGRSATPAHLIQGMRDGKLPRLLAMLLPQVAALLLMGLLMVVIVGP